MLAEIRKVVSKDNETKNLNISDTDLLVVYNYLLIRDKKKESNLPDGYKLVLRSEPHIHTVLVPTTEKIKELEVLKARELIDTLGIDNYLLDASLEGFETLNEERTKAHKYALSFIKNYKEKKIKPGMLLVGKYRTGKSYLLSAIANELIKNYVSVVYVYFPDLVRVIKDSISTNTLEEKVASLKKCDCLFLDDLGAENMTPWFRDDILGPVLQYRLAANLPVFISTNFSSKELIDLLGTSKNETDRVKAGRIVTRILEMTKVFNLSEMKYDKK